jgi:hypothetical protein
VVTITALPIAQFPNIVPPEAQVLACSTCASAALTAACAARLACTRLSNWVCATTRLCQRSISVDIHLGFAELSLGLSQLGVRLIEESLERAWIDLKKNLTLADERAFFVRLPNDVREHTVAG